MAKRVNGAGVNRSAARKASEIAALRRARLAAREAAVTEAVAVFFDRSGRAAGVRQEAKTRAERIMVEAEQAAKALERQADSVVAGLKALGEPVVEIATMTGLPVAGVRAAIARARDARCEGASAGQKPTGPRDDAVVGDVAPNGVVSNGGP